MDVCIYNSTQTIVVNGHAFTWEGYTKTQCKTQNGISLCAEITTDLTDRIIEELKLTGKDVDMLKFLRAVLEVPIIDA